MRSLARVAGGFQNDHRNPPLALIGIVNILMAQLPKGGLVGGYDKPIHGELRHLLSRWYSFLDFTHPR